MNYTVFSTGLQKLDVEQKFSKFWSKNLFKLLKIIENFKEFFSMIISIHINYIKNEINFLLII